MKPGRKPIPRDQRIAQGLPVCVVEGCDLAPHHTGQKCGPHYGATPRKQRRRGGVSAHVQYSLRPDVVLAVQFEAERRGVYPSVVVEELVVAAAKTWGRSEGSPG